MHMLSETKTNCTIKQIQSFSEVNPLHPCETWVVWLDSVSFAYMDSFLGVEFRGSVQD